MIWAFARDICNLEADLPEIGQIQEPLNSSVQDPAEHTCHTHRCDHVLKVIAPAVLSQT